MRLSTPRNLPSKMDDTTNEQQGPNKSILCTVLDQGEIALIKVLGKGNFSNSLPLKRFVSHVFSMNSHPRFILDMVECEMMDSTFMGVLAGTCIQQTRNGGGKVIVVNANAHCQRLLKTLGLTHLLEMQTGTPEELQRGEEELKPILESKADKVDQICLTLRAHKDLAAVDPENKIRFQNVIEYLEKSLQEEKKEGDF